MRANLKKYNPVKNNIASILYLYEVAAIPRSIREEYLQKILKRKNAVGQKNVKLINLIYQFIENGNMFSWDSGKICKELDVTYNTYRFHKSNFLDGLRKYYFKPDSVNEQPNELYLEYTEFEREFYTAKIKFYSGMRKEAKIIFLTLACRMKKTKLKHNNISIASEIYEHLLIYYYNQHDLVRYNRYLKSLNRIVNLLTSGKIIPDKHSKALIKARYYIAMGRKFAMNLVNDNSFTMKLNYYNMAYKEAKTAKSPEYLTNVIFHIGEAKSVLRNNKSSLDYYNKGYKIAVKNRMYAEKFGFKALMVSEYYSKRNFEPAKYIDNIAKCYNKVKELGYNSYWFQVVSIIYSNCLISIDEQKRKEINKELINYLFLRSIPGRAIKILYADKSSENNFVKWELFKGKNGEYLRPKEINYYLVYELENLVKYITSHYHKISFLAGKIKINMDLLFIEFLKGKKINFELTAVLINKIKWGLREKKLLVRFDSFKLLEIALSMVENYSFMAKKEFLNKYCQKFEELSDHCLSSKDENPMYIYLIICMNAKWIGYKELWDIAEKKYRYLEQNFPNHVYATIKEIVGVSTSNH